MGIIWGDDSWWKSQADVDRETREAAKKGPVHRDAGDHPKSEQSTWWGGTKEVKKNFWGDEIKEPKRDFWGNKIEEEPKKSWWDW